MTIGRAYNLAEQMEEIRSNLSYIRCMLYVQITKGTKLWKQ